MGHYDLNSANILLNVLKAGSFRKAALVLGIPKSNVSRKVSELESHLGAKLLSRNTRSVSLTEAGRVFVKHAEIAMEHFEGAERAVSDLQQNPKGRLRITATLPMGQHFLSGMVAEFLKSFPEIEVSLHLTDREVDLVSERFDIAIRAGELPDSSMVAKLLGKSRYELVASPAYLRKQGQPHAPESLSSHSCLLFSSSNGIVWSEWPLRSGTVIREYSVTGRFIANDFIVLREAAVAGIGIARIPSHFVKELVRTGKLVSILDSFAPPATPIHLLHVGGRKLPQSTRAFIDFLCPRFSQALG